MEEGEKRHLPFVLLCWKCPGKELWEEEVWRGCLVTQWEGRPEGRAWHEQEGGSLELLSVSVHARAPGRWIGYNLLG